MKVDETNCRQILSAQGIPQLMYVASCEIELFTFLGRNPGATLEQVAEGTALPRHSARVLLASCCAIGLVERDADGRYTNGAFAGAMLTADGDPSLRIELQYHQRIIMPPAQHLGASLKAGKNLGLQAVPGTAPTLYGRLDENPDLEAIYFASMSGFSRAVSPALCSVEALAGVRNLADMGSGDGQNSITLLQTFPDLRVSLVDSAARCELARKRLAEQGLEGRATFHPGDFAGHADGIPAGVDAIMFCHSLSVVDEDEVRAVFAKCHAALPPGGLLVYYEVAFDDDETGPYSAAGLSLYLLVLATGKGMAWPGRDVSRWMQEAGFQAPVARNLPGLDHVLVVARK